MNYSYYTDSLNKYLVIPLSGAEDNPDGYQHRMIAANHIGALLPCALRRIDQKCFLYYDVTNTQTLSSRFANRRVGAKEAEDLLYQVAEAGRDIAGFLLDAAHLILDPDLMFYDYGTERYRFVYYPETAEEEVGSLGRPCALLSFLVGKTPMLEPRCAKAVLYLRDRCREPDFILQEAVLDRAFERHAEKDKEDSHTGTGDLAEPETGAEDVPIEELWTDPLQDEETDAEEDWLADPVPEIGPPPEPVKSSGGREGTILAFSLFFLSAALFMEWARVSLPLREEMSLLLDVGIIFTLVVAAALAITGVIRLATACVAGLHRIAD
ncbi:MAG: hypothetical protein J6I56_09675 [Lachnospiraceae bacterium]|nr:hypothetical protein [Lachnospiraceae bacterium]